ncbi:MAG: DNA mismatch repair endonuclease MutL [Saprospiraceae bacterium]
MTNVIQLLPENVANQIAAGEVVQRPSSVVKELMENAIDAGATQIKLILRDAGKTLVQVVDDGCGMSETDARMCFERHATSKIREARDLFEIRTMGFRGEAMASIAAVAQVEMRTRRAVDELGTRVVVEDSAVKIHEPCQAPPGTSIAVKNLFFNVPARRNFLKGDPVEMRHVLDEFQRIAVANPDLFFSLHHNDQELFHLPPGNLRQRIVKVFGEAANKKLVPVHEETDILKISGFVGKPDYFKKSRGEQLFFVNGRFIKSSYLHHAVVGAFEEMLPPDTYPLYVLFLEIAPSRIDINVHPTKQEIKFDDEKLVYNYLKVTVRHALGAYSVTPTLDFEQEPAFQASSGGASQSRHSGHRAGSVRDYPPKSQDDDRANDNLRNWQRLYEGLDLLDPKQRPDAESQPTIFPSEASADETPSEGFDLRPSAEPTALDDESGSFSKGQKEPYQIHGQYIVSQIKSGFMLVDQQAASERILYERYLEALRQQPVATQQALFPKNIELPPADAALLRAVLPDVNRLGFDISEFGGDAFIIHGTPSDMGAGLTEEALLERLLAQYKNNLDLDLGTHENLARAMARSAALKRGQSLSAVEMQDLIDQLFACPSPYRSPSGRTCFITFELDELQRRFSN